MRYDEYRANIDRLISEGSGELVLNGSHEHASIIIERMLTHAKEHVRILCRKFDPRIFGTTPTVDAARLFLGLPERKLDIIIEEYDEAALLQHPFFQAIAPRPNLTVFEMNVEMRSVVNFNFSTMDDAGYRFEEDKAYPIAVAAFGGDRSFAARLVETFDKLAQISSRRVVGTLQAA